MKLSREAKIGITTIVTFVLFIWGFNFLKGKNIFARTHTFYAIYDNLNGLKESGAILLNGYEVGQVNSIKIMREEGNKLLVRFLINKNIEVPEGSIAELASIDIMNSMAINLILSSKNEQHQDGDTLVSRVEKGMLESFDPTLDKIESIATSLDTLLLSVNTTFDESTRRNIQKTIQNLETTSDGLVELMSENGDIHEIIADVKQLTYHLEESTRELPALVRNISEISDSLKNSRLNEVILNTEKVLSQADTMMKYINSGEGSLGKLLSNDSLYTNLANASKELELLLNDLREHPKRYVHFSVFGNKDE